MKLKPSRNNLKLALTAISIGVLFCTGALAADAGAASSKTARSTPPVFARVGKTIITQREYDGEFANASRNRFYHGKPPDSEVAQMQREVGDKLINNVLLQSEAKRRKLKPDSAAVKKKLEQHEQRNAGNQQWQKARIRALPVLTMKFQEENLRIQLEKKVRKVRAPSNKQLRAYYTAHQVKFTEPEQLRVSLILLNVDPSSPQGTWDAASEKGADLLKQLREGADFAELATQHSGDTETVAQGGDMGYLHGGMMSELAQQSVDKLKIGENSDLIQMMEGMVIFKLVDRKPPNLNSFETVEERVRELWLADEGERAWKSLIAKLRKNTRIKVDESHFLPLPEPDATTATESVAQPATDTAGKAAASK